MARYSPTVRPDDEPTRDPTRFGRQVSDAFARYREDVRTDELQDREDAEYEANAPLRDLRRRAGEVEAEEYLRDTRGYVPSDRSSGTMPRRPDPSRFDPELARDLFRGERVGMARSEPQRPEPGAYVGNLPGAQPPMEEQDIVALPGQFMGGQFSPEVVRIGGRAYQVDPTQTAEARGARAAAAQAESEEAAFQRQVEELVAAGVDPQQAPAIVRQGLADDFLQPEEEPVTYDPDQGIFPDEETKRAFLEYRRQLALADEAGRLQRDQADSRGGRGGGSGDAGPISVEDAFDRLQEIYSQTDRRGQTTLLLPEADLVRLANAWAAGRISEEELPALEDLMPAEEMPEAEEGGGLWSWVKGFFQNERETGPGPAPTQAGPPPGERQESSAAAVDSARAIVREFPGVPPSQIRMILEDEGFTPREIDQVLGQGG